MALALGMGLSACQSSVQTTSGADYVRAAPFADAGIAEAADVEPLLKFPAQFCMVQTNQGRMVYSEPQDLAVWLDVASRHADWGSFREVSPEVVQLVRSQMGDHYAGSVTTEVIRAAAARQHCDAILSYQLQEGEGAVTARALLYDVRNGYPYITAAQTGANAREAMKTLASDVEASMAELVRALARS